MWVCRMTSANVYSAPLAMERQEGGQAGGYAITTGRGEQQLKDMKRQAYIYVYIYTRLVPSKNVIWDLLFCGDLGFL